MSEQASHRAGLVSCIIPVFNREQMLREAVECVLAQTYRPLEVVVVDDGSTDNTGAVAAELVAASPNEVFYVRQENAGPGMARNTGLQHARGEFVQYLDSDDLILPRKFELQVAQLQADPQAGLSYCLSMRADKQGRRRAWARTGENIERILPEFLLQRGWHTISPLWRRTACEAIGPWKPFRVMEDWEHDCRAGLLGVRPVYCPEPLVEIRDHTEHRACGGTFSRDVMLGYFQAHRSVFHLLHEAGRTDAAHLRGFSRKLFWIARMCGERDLTDQAEEALAMAMECAAPFTSTRGMQMFHTATRVFGWKSTVTVSERARNIFRGGKESAPAQPASTSQPASSSQATPANS
jgi:glycosyltransferase involved in cell wall biosynthesis